MNHAKFTSVATQRTIAILVIAIGLIVGDQIGKFRAAEKRSARRRLATIAALDRMQSIEIGGIFPDRHLETLDGDYVWLSELIADTSLISFFASACDACLTEIANAASVCDENQKLDNVILISAESISRLRSVRDEYSLFNTVLYDYGGEFSRELKIHNFPFNIIVDSEMTICQVFSGVIPPTELENIVRCK